MSGRLPALKPKDVFRALQRAGFYLHHTTGSHYILKHPDKPALRVTLPWHDRDLKRGTQRKKGTGSKRKRGHFQRGKDGDI